MINIAVSKFFKDLKEKMNEYGIISDVKYSSDVDLISEYTKSFRLRTLMNDYKLINDSDMTKLNDNPNYVVGLYNRKSIAKIDDMANNIKIDAIINPYQPNNEILGKQVLELKTELQVFDIDIRSAIYGQIEVKCKLLTANSNTLELLEFLLMDNYIKKNPLIQLSLKMSPTSEPIEFDYNTKFDAIDEYGLVDTKSYGDLQQISFSFVFYGVFLSMFKKSDKTISSVEFLSELI